MSDYLVHFTESEASLMSILRDGQVRAGGPYGWARSQPEVRDGHMCACLSEVPLDQADRIAKRHGPYGIGFRRDFVRRRGGARVWYLDDPSHVARWLNDQMGDLRRAGDFEAGLWHLTPFIDPVIANRYHFEWEREWRVPGGLRFKLPDVAFLITPDPTLQMKFERELDLRTPHATPDGDTWWGSVIPELSKGMEDLVTRFLQCFEEPIKRTSTDSGAYVWLTPPCPTEEAIEEVFGELEPTIYAALHEYLDEISSDWVRLKDFEGWWDH